LIRAIVLTGVGRAFCSGGDLKFAHEANPDVPGNSFLALTSILHHCIETIREMSKPVIAAINGPAAGAGLFLALACDLRVMAKTAYLKQSNTSHGLSLPAGGTFMLPRLVGIGRALEIIMLDDPIPGREALKIGLVHRLVSTDQLALETQQLAARVAQMPGAALGQVKRLMNDSFYSTLTEQLAAERQAIAITANSPEGREGVAAFLQKRQPNYVAEV
jgi:2-(1,2-epoxy-1,2-dihydrophenyl)acetyl-CoA isomerase